MSIDKSDVGHRHTASDIRGGKFPLAMLPDEVVTDDELTAAVAAIDVDVPAASDTVPGIVELADIAETIDGTDDTRAVTPYALSFRSATDVRTGLVELATVAEAIAGTDTARAVTPAGVKAVADTKSSTSHGHALTDAAITGTLAVAKGGTGATTTADARTNLDVYSKSETAALIPSPAVVAQTTTGMGPGFVTETTIVTAPTVTANGTARYKITVTPAAFTMTQYEFWEFRIRRGTTLIRASRWVAPSNALTAIPTFTVTDIPAAGTHTYALSLIRVAGTNTATMTASSTNPAEIIVEQI